MTPIEVSISGGQATPGVVATSNPPATALVTMVPNPNNPLSVEDAPATALLQTVADGVSDTTPVAVASDTTATGAGEATSSALETMKSGLVGNACTLTLQVVEIAASSGIIVEVSNTGATGEWVTPKERPTNGSGGLAFAATSTTAFFEVMVTGWKFWRVRQYIYGGSGSSRVAVWFGISPPALVQIDDPLRGINPASTSHGGLVHRLLASAASQNPTAVRATAGRIYTATGRCKAGITGPVYLKLYNKATAPTSGDTPFWTHELTPGEGFRIDFGALGQYTSAGLGYRITGAVADNDATDIGAGDVTCMNIWHV